MALSLNKKRIKKITVKAAVFIVSFLLGMFLARATKAQEAKSLLWKIEGNQLEEPSYLYGTIHMICKDDFIFTEAVKNALNETSQTVLELDMDDPQFMTNMQRGIMNEGMKNISNEYSEKQQTLINDFFKTHYGMDMTMLGMIKPYGLLAMIVQKSITCTEVESYEQTLVKNAKEREIELLGLETVEFQTSLFDNTPLDEQIDLVTISIKDFDEGKEEFNRMVATYKKQDLLALKKIMSESPEYAQYEDLMINDRNENWIPKIEEFAKEKSTFFAVGALHLPGEKGVIKLLQKEGYTVSPVY